MQAIPVSTEHDMLAFAAACAPCLSAGDTVFLRGDLGAGKTTWTRGLLIGLGHQGAVPSPTYTLVESYLLQGKTIYHFDLYRMESADELEAIGIRDMLDGQSIALIEWPDRGDGLLPTPTWQIDIQHQPNGRLINTNLSVQWPAPESGT